MYKAAGHAHDRMKSRAGMKPGTVESMEKAIRRLALKPGNYYTEVRDKSGYIKGYATFSPFGKKKTLHMTTVLSPDMSPRGQYVDLKSKYANLRIVDFVRSSVEKTAEASAPPALNTGEKSRIRSYMRDGKMVRSHERGKKPRKVDLTAAGTVATAAMAGAGATTLISGAGKSIVVDKDPAPVYTNAKTLFTKVKPGDYVLSAATGLQKTNVIVGISTGYPDAMHSSLVSRVFPDGSIEVLDYNDSGMHRARLDPEGRYRYTPAQLQAKTFQKMEGEQRNITILRAKNPDDAAKAVKNYTRRLEVFEKMRQDFLRLGVSEQDSYKLLGQTFNTSYFSKGGFAEQGFRELFTPFFKPASNVSVQKQIALGEAALTNLENNRLQYSRKMVDAFKKGKKAGDLISPYVRTICSTAVTMSGMPAFGNKLPMGAAPHDVYRSKQMRTIGHFRPKGYYGSNRTVHRVMTATPTLVRAALGAGLGVTALAAGVAIKSKMSSGQEKTASFGKIPKISPLRSTYSAAKNMASFKMPSIVTDAAGPLLGAAVMLGLGYGIYRHGERSLQKRIDNEVKLVGPKPGEAKMPWKF